ncbi:hypothetical protein J6590_055695 [Homalodisca vitripennis]|nr:hypothetical protein J6590_055695 [Homalodisca vitripennis]
MCLILTFTFLLVQRLGSDAVTVLTPEIWSHVNLKTSKKVGDEEARIELVTSIPLHLDYTIFCGLGVSDHRCQVCDSIKVLAKSILVRRVACQSRHQAGSDPPGLPVFIHTYSYGLHSKSLYHQNHIYSGKCKKTVELENLKWGMGELLKIWTVLQHSSLINFLRDANPFLALFYPSSRANGLCEDLIKHNRDESRYSTRSIVLIKEQRSQTGSEPELSLTPKSDI